MTLPLSYSRLRARSFAVDSCCRNFLATSLAAPSKAKGGLPPEARVKFFAHPRAKDGGEGRTRTFEAARATDLQSAAFDRFATSPASLCCWKRDVSVVLKKARMFLAVAANGAGEGI